MKDGKFRDFILGILGGLLGNVLWNYSKYKIPPVPAAPNSHNPTSTPTNSLWTYKTTAKPGAAGTLQTLAWMAWLVRKDASDLQLRALAESIVADCPGHDFDCEVKAIFEYVRDSITFRKDPADCERVQDAKRTIKSKTGDCDDKSVLLASLLAAIGHKSCFSVLGSSTNNFSHVYVSLLTRSGQAIPLDPTPENSRVGWQGQARVMRHYKIF